MIEKIKKEYEQERRESHHKKEKVIIKNKRKTSPFRQKIRSDEAKENKNHEHRSLVFVKTIIFKTFVMIPVVQKPGAKYINGGDIKAERTKVAAIKHNLD
uniref:Uncharacterized protein n=1 Tax=Romanomermis culicivorax TaxID=13658 RepID=A0A915L2Z2_ROMCU